MKINFHPQFKKSYQKRIINNPKLRAKVIERINIFQQDPQNPLLKNHSLVGTHFGHRAFWVTGDIRIIYEQISDSETLFLDIGSHNQVY